MQTCDTGCRGPLVASSSAMKIPEYHDATDDDAPTGALTENLTSATDASSNPLRERSSSDFVVAEHVAAEAAERVLVDENVSAEEIAEQSAYSGPETDVGQQAAHAERAQSDATSSPPAK